MTNNILTVAVNIMASNGFKTTVNIITALPGVILTVFSLYFIYQKMRPRVLASFAICVDPLTEDRIHPVVLINKQNKPVAIFSIQAVLENRVVLEIKKFEAPLILKPLESTRIETDPFSYLMLAGKEWKPSYQSKTVDLYLLTEHKKIKCKIITPPGLIDKGAFFESYMTAGKFTKRFNKQVYNDNVKYALVYKNQGHEQTAFILNSGFITGDWPFPHNMIPKESLETQESVKLALVEAGYDKLSGTLQIHSLENPKGSSHE